MLSLTRWLGRMIWGSTTVCLGRDSGMRRLVVRPRRGGASRGSRSGERVVLGGLKAFSVPWLRRFMVSRLEICAVVSLKDYVGWRSTCFTHRYVLVKSFSSCEDLQCFANTSPQPSTRSCHLRQLVHRRQKVPGRRGFSLASGLV